MPLSDDQRAMLRLLAQREQGYDDLAALMGLSVEEVRAKVAEALAQLEEEGAPAPPVPSEPREEPAEPKPQVEPTEPPRVEEKPAAPPEPAKAEPPPSEPTPSGAPRASGIILPKGGARAALVAGAAVVVLLIVVLALSGGDDSGDATTAASEGATTSEETTTNAANSKQVTQAVLDPVDGGDAQGVAIFGRIKNALALQVEATGLAPTGKGQSYTIWLYESPRKMLPLASTAVGNDGKIGAQVQVPTEVLAYLAQETFDQIDISLTSDETLKASLAKATSEKKAPLYTGTDVLRGRITGPIIGAAKNTGE